MRKQTLLIIVLLPIIFSTACATAEKQEQPRPQEQTATSNEPSRPALRDELLQMRAEDQAVRTKLMEEMEASNNIPATLAHRLQQIDAKNTQRLREIIDELGRWPGIDIVGQKGADAAWLLAQHADMAPDTQQFFLEKLRVAVENDQAPPKHYAYLVDRVRLKEGKPQLYGTQFDIVDGDLKLKPIAEPEKLDQRREEMGLEPIGDYLERSRKMLLSEE